MNNIAKIKNKVIGLFFCREIFGFFAAVLIFYKDYFIMSFGVRAEYFGIFILMLTSLYSIYKDGANNLIEYWHFMLFVMLPILILISTLNSGVINSSSYFAAFFVASFIVMSRFKSFLSLATAVMTLNFLVQVYEVITGQFLFVYVDDEFEYDEKMLGSGEGSFRAKGFFGSPLNAIGITMSLALLRPKSIFNWVLLLLSSSLGQGRLGMGVAIVGMIVVLFLQNNISIKIKFFRLIIILISMISAAILAVIFGSDESIDRIMSAASSDNDQNASRLDFWGASVKELANYELGSLFFGKFGYIKSLIGGTESDWLRLWLDNGLFFMLIYILPLAMGVWWGIISRRWVSSFSFFLTIFVMAVYPHGQSMPNGSLVWLTIFVALYRSRKIIDSHICFA